MLGLKRSENTRSRGAGSCGALKFQAHISFRFPYQPQNMLHCTAHWAILFLFTVLNVTFADGFRISSLTTVKSLAFIPLKSANEKQEDREELSEVSTRLVNESRMEKANRGSWSNLQKSPLVWKGLMLFICVIWATNFAVIKKIFEVLPDGVLDPSLYVAIRFAIAAVVMLPGAIGSLRNWGLVKNGILVGLCVFLGYIGQSMGILTSTANKTAFFCSMNVIWVALVTALMTRKFSARTWVSVLLTVSGAAFIELRGVVAPTVNDLWLLLQPIGFGSGYLVLEQNMKQFPDSAQAITSLKLLTVSICTLAWAIFNGHKLADLKPILSNGIATAGLLYTGLFTTAFAILLQSVVFKRVSSTDASIILTSEPIWAALFAVGKSFLSLSFLMKSRALPHLSYHNHFHLLARVWTDSADRGGGDVAGRGGRRAHHPGLPGQRDGLAGQAAQRVEGQEGQEGPQCVVVVKYSSTPQAAVLSVLHHPLLRTMYCCAGKTHFEYTSNRNYNM